MAKPNEFASVFLDVDVGTRPHLEKPEPETPFRILILGDFSGRVNRRTERPPRYQPVLIDRDSFSEILAGMGAGLHLGEEGSGRIALSFRELDDFHPDQIYQQHEIFRPLREVRRKLNDPRTFAEAAAEVAAWSGLPAPVHAGGLQPLPETPQKPLDLGSLTSSSLLEDILDASESRARPDSRARDPLQSFLKQALGPHLQPREDRQLPALLAQVDEASGKLMRAILHHKDFQALEAAWRAVFFLVRGLETGTQLKVYLLDISKRELASELSGTSLKQAPLYRVLVDDSANDPEDGGWAVVAGNFSFDQSERDTDTLSRLGQLMRATDAPFIAEADLGGGTESADADAPWDKLRRSPEASWLGLALPRFLVRLPYGEETDQVESFRFEEMPGTPVHRDYLWANPSIACVHMLGEAFSGQGWHLQPGSRHEITGLPLHVYSEEGEKRLRPCVELPMTPDDVEWALESGYMPLVWTKGEDAVRLSRLQSIAEPLARLAGRWA